MKQCVLCKEKQFDILFPHHNNWKMGKCLSCGLVQVVPMPSAKEIGELYHEDFDHFTPYIEQLAVHHAYFKQKVEEIGWKIKAMPAGRQDLRFKKKTNIIVNPTSYLSNLTLLDIGCAMGVTLDEAKKKGMKVVGIDLSADAVTYCRKKGFTCYNGTVQSLGAKLKPGSFAVVTAFQVVEHERDPLTMMKQVRTLLVDDGLVVLATPNYGGFWRRVMGRKWFGFAHPEHVVLFDHDTMRQLLEKAGFRDIEVRADSPRPFPLSFAFTRGSDYFPWLAWLLRPMGKMFDRFDIKNPINPWDDMIAFGRK